MIRTLLLSAALVAETSPFALAGALYEGRSAATDHPPMVHARRHHVRASGRCNGISYGTGQRSCGTATGGPPGGNPSRN